MQLLPLNSSTGLAIAEITALVLAVVGLLIFLVTGNQTLFSIGVVIALVLNQWHRRQGDRRVSQRFIADVRRIRQEITAELEEMRQSLHRQSAGGFAQLQTSQDLELAMVQIRRQNAQLDQSLQQVMQALGQLAPEMLGESIVNGSSPMPSGSVPDPNPLDPHSPDPNAPDFHDSKDHGLGAGDSMDDPAPLTPGDHGSDRPALATEQDPQTQDDRPLAVPNPAPPLPPNLSASLLDRIPPRDSTRIAPLSPSLPPLASWQEALRWQRGSSFAAHGGWVNAIALSPNGQELATGGNDQHIRLWDVATARLIGEYVTPSPISALTFSADGQILASGNYDHRIQLWHRGEGRVITTLEGHYGSVQALQFITDPQVDRCLVSGSYDQTLRLWDIATGESDCLEGHEGSIQSLVLNPQPWYLASGGEEGHIRLWRLPDGELLGTLAQGSSSVEALVISPDGQTLASGCSNGTLHLWHLPSQSRHYCLEGHTGPITALVITPDGQTLISGGADGRLKLWHLPTGQPQGNLADPIDAILSLSLSQEGNLLVSSHPGGQVQLWWRQETP